MSGPTRERVVEWAAQSGFGKLLKGDGLPTMWWGQPLELLDRFATLAYAAGQASKQEWQPIETAPRDGTAILVTNGKGVWIAKHKAVYQSGYVPDNAWFCLMLNRDYIPARFRRGYPTHWMPLPAAPSQEGGAA